MSLLTYTDALQVLAIAVGAFLVMGLVYSLSKFEQLSRAAESRSARPMDKRSAFLLRIAARLGLGRTREGAFCVVLADATEKPGGASVGAERLVAALKPLLRDEADEWMEMDGGRVGLLIRCEPALLEKVVARWTRSCGLVLRVGAAGYPAAAAHSEALLESAEDALGVVIAAGGQGFRIHPEDVARPPAGGPDEGAPDPRVVDPLTGVLRSERVGAAALKFMARWRREGRSVALLLLKFDDLEAVRERYGASARDESLRNMGRLLSISVREEDLIGRLDEDEFMVLAALHEGDGLTMARRVLDRYMQAGSRPGGAPVRGTVSAGVAAAPADAREFIDVLKCARTALNRGRRAGRGRCTRYTAAMAAERRRLDGVPRDRF